MAMMSLKDATSSFERIKLLGSALPVNGNPKYQLKDWGASNIIVRERTMLAMISEITDKPEWDKKSKDETIVSKWRNVALVREGIDFSQAMFDHCIPELLDKLPHYASTTRVTVLDSEAAIVKSDTTIPPFLADELKAAVKPLEDVPPERFKDRHLGSNEKVLDLVHTSL
ncbi:hypothetical protein PM082_012006 [Marasmius tenuissimus]|nr:hypothetical protein PM082_012006 [Marasmius tenuissimus]